ncbi:MAG: hypothetical protein ACOCTM_02265 [Bacteroidota bacterium]
MDKDYLSETARALKQVDPEVAKEYRAKSDELISQINKRMLERPEVKNLVGEDNLGMMKDNHANHVRFITSILRNYNPQVFVDTVLWVFRAYRSHGFTANYWATQLNIWMEILKDTLTPESYRAVYPYYEWMQVNIPVFVKLTDEDIEASNSGH